MVDSCRWERLLVIYCTSRVSDVAHLFSKHPVEYWWSMRVLQVVVELFLLDCNWFSRLGSWTSLSLLDNESWGMTGHPTLQSRSGYCHSCQQSVLPQIPSRRPCMLRVGWSAPMGPNTFARGHRHGSVSIPMFVLVVYSSSVMSEWW